MHNSLPLPSIEPFHLSGEQGSALLLHGFTGTPYELRNVGVALNQAGFSCDAPLLPGHGETPEILNQTRVDAWLKSARDAFAALPSKRPRILVGHSMGGLLATILAAEFEVDGLVLISPAYQLRPIGRLGALLSRLGLYHIIPAKKKRHGSDIADPVGRSLNPAYPSLPLRALIEFDNLRRLALKRIPKVKCPVFVAFGERDHTVDPNGSAVQVRRFRVPHLEQHVFANSFHILPLDVDRDELITRILVFCKSYA